MAKNVGVVKYNDLNSWIEYGVLMGWAEKFCFNHGPLPMTEREERYLDSEDMHIPVLRIWIPTD